MPLHSGTAAHDAQRVGLVHAVPVIVIVLIILAVWYLAAIPMNRVVAEPKFPPDAGHRRNHPGFPGRSTARSCRRRIRSSPNCGTPSSSSRPTSRARSSIMPGSRFPRRLLGFINGTILGIALAAAIVQMKTMRQSLMPWLIASQTIPILAIAPMVIVVLGSIGFTGLVPKSIISTYLCFFPVAIGMVKGLTSPEVMQLDLMRTYNASDAQVFWKLRWPASLPFLFASLKVAIAIALVGAIVGELPTGAQAGIGARLLNGSYYGQTIQIWAALFAAAIMSAVLVWLIGVIERITARLMGARP